MANIERERSDEFGSEESSWSSASKISRKVRELAGRAHSALKTGAVSAERAPAIGHDRDDLRIQVARLQQKIHSRRLGALVPWVDALRQQVERRLGDDEAEKPSVGDPGSFRDRGKHP
jgi:hypothetical protein